SLALASDLSVMAGFITFFIFGGSNHLWLLPFALFLLSFLKRQKKQTYANERLCFFPYAAGLLIWPMRLFYWDRGDFALRIQNLLLLATLFAFFFLIRRRRLVKKFLLYFNTRTLKKRLLAIFVSAELLFILAAGVLTQRGVALVGDEPHYLAISQSLARDGDLNVFNQYFRDGFKEFLHVKKLAAHGTWGKGFKKIYSYHLPGVSLTLAPFFFVKLSPPLLYFLLRSYLGLFAALLAMLVYLFCLRLWRSRSLAFFATVVFSLTVPVFFYSFHIFPEIQAMLLILSALYLLLFKANAKNSHCLWAGLLLGSSIFWGVKYALFIYPICLGFFAYWLFKKNPRSALLLIVFPLLFQALFFYYLYSAYGNFSPNSVYYGMLSPEQSGAFYETILKKITLNMRWETLLDYFFDQRDGLLLYNPFYFFAFPGLLLALRNFKRYRLQLLLVLPAVLFVLNHAFSTIRAGYCPQGRYLTPVVWALLLFAVIYYRESRSPFFKKVFLSLPLYSLFVSIYQTAQPFTLYQPTTHDTLLRTGLLFQNWSNSRIDLPALLPSYVKTANHGYLPNSVMAMIFLLLVFLALTGRRSESRNWYDSLAPILVFLGIFSLSSLFPRPDLANPQRLSGPRDLPCQIYFNPAAAAGSEKATWLCSGQHVRMRIETLVPLKSVEIRIQNRSASGALEMTVALFDAATAHLSLQPGAGNQVHLDQPRYKKNKSRFSYQFDLQARKDLPRNTPAWLLGLRMR
ncbi:MAG TPA: hypothetical protein VMZ49_12785, partial [Patescibacteria group bacterium]|nr:hypothetical protein [Patescibacteria group bacterium]